MNFMFIFNYFFMLLEKAALRKDKFVSMHFNSQHGGTFQVMMFDGSKNATVYFYLSEKEKSDLTNEKMGIIQRFILDEQDIDSIIDFLQKKGAFY